jgi:CBS domain containing-hemolysin-like protein
VILFLELLAVAALILLNAFFVAAEYGLVTARRTRIRELEQEGNRRARGVLQIVSDPPRFIAAMQLGVTATSLGIGALGEQALARVFDPILASLIAFAIAFLIITFLHVVIGELVPKGVALRHSETVALAVSAPVRGFFILLKPLIWVLQHSSELVLRALGIEPPGADPEALRAALAAHGIRPVNWTAWLRVDAEEVRRGGLRGAERVKVAELAEMLEHAHGVPTGS